MCIYRWGRGNSETNKQGGYYNGYDAYQKSQTANNSPQRANVFENKVQSTKAYNANKIGKHGFISPKSNGQVPTDMRPYSAKNSSTQYQSTNLKNFNPFNESNGAAPGGNKKNKSMTLRAHSKKNNSGREPHIGLE